MERRKLATFQYQEAEKLLSPAWNITPAHNQFLGTGVEPFSRSLGPRGDG
jgi:hypothetical protein